MVPLEKLVDGCCLPASLVSPRTLPTDAPFALKRPTRVTPPFAEAPARTNAKLPLKLLVLVGTLGFCATASPESIPPEVLTKRTRLEYTIYKTEVCPAMLAMPRP